MPNGTSLDASQPCKVHQARHVAAGEDIGLRSKDVVHFQATHASRDVRKGDGKGTSETAALLALAKWDDLRIADGFEKGKGGLSAVRSARVAGAMEGDLGRLLEGAFPLLDAEAVLGKTGIDNACGILLKFPEEKIAILHSTLMSDTRTEAFIYGSAGYIHIHSSWHKMTKVSLHLNDKDMVQHFEFEKNSQGYNYEAEEAMRCIAEGKLESEAMSHAFSLQLIETLDAIRHKAGINFPEID